MRPLLLALCFITSSAMAGTAPKSDFRISLQIVNPPPATTSFVFKAQEPTPVKYVAQPVACNHRHNRCIDLSGKPIGSMDEVIATLPEVDAVDVGRGLACDRLCYDHAGHVVGKAPAR